jgi:hypothetical protein
MTFHCHTIVIRVKGNDISFTLYDISLTQIDTPLKWDDILLKGDVISFAQIAILISLNGMGIKKGEKSFNFSCADSLNAIN